MRMTRSAAVLAAATAAATAAVLAPAAAQAASPRTLTKLLGTYDFGRATVVGKAGLTAGTWSSFAVRPGFAGDDLTVTYRPRTSPRATETQVYTAAFNEVRDARAECERVGADGVTHKVWVSFRCRTGFAPSYTLLVR